MPGGRSVWRRNSLGFASEALRPKEVFASYVCRVARATVPLRPLLMTSAFATLLLADENLPAPILDAASADDVRALGMLPT